MNERKRCFAACLLAITLVSPALSQTTDTSIERVLNQVYDGYDREHACWTSPYGSSYYVDSSKYFCFQISRIDRMETDTGPRIYVLLTGNLLGVNEDVIISHAEAGMIGAFVISRNHDGLKIIASDPMIPDGSWGNPSDEWTLVKLAPTDYWGWQTNSAGFGQGTLVETLKILAPDGKRVRELAGFQVLLSEGGGCLAENGCRPTRLETKVEIESSRTDARVFPLRLTVTGEINEKKIEPKTWILPFDVKSWSYPIPKDWVFSHLYDED